MIYEIITTCDQLSLLNILGSDNKEILAIELGLEGPTYLVLVITRGPRSRS